MHEMDLTAKQHPYYGILVAIHLPDVLTYSDDVLAGEHDQQKLNHPI